MGTKVKDIEDTIKQIKDRISKATPGPWYYYGLVGWLGIVIGTTPEETTIKDKPEPSFGDPDFSTNIIGVNYENFEGKEEDCKFIAHAPEDMQFLLNIVEKQREEITSLRAEMRSLLGIGYGDNNEEKSR